MSRPRLVLFFLGAAALVSACKSAKPPADKPTPPCSEAAVPGMPFGTRCGQLVDDQGRVVILRGVNARVAGVFDVTFDDGRTALEPIPPFTADDAAAMRTWGFDALRLPINWSAIEPKDGAGFDEAYLDRVAAVVEFAKAAGVTVLVDLHQDAYSKEIGEDGAPLWAIEPPPPMLLQGPLGDLGARRLSKPVLDAFETFFGTSAAGAALRARYAAMAAHVATRFANDDGVFGFEIFNEPVTDDDGVRRLNDSAYAGVHAAATQKLYLFEPTSTRNLVDSATIGMGSIGPSSVYAPHVYTYSFSPNPGGITLSKDDLLRSNASAREEADGYHAPLVITEWGFDPKLANAPDYVRFEQELQDDVMASSFFWVWKETSQGQWGCFDSDASGVLTERTAFKRAIAHVRPSRIAGFPRSFGYDTATGHFELLFYGDPSVRGMHEIVVPGAIGGVLSVQCDGKAVKPASTDGFVIKVACGGGDGYDHDLAVNVAPP